MASIEQAFFSSAGKDMGDVVTGYWLRVIGEEKELSGGGEIEVAGGSDRGIGEGIAFGEAMGDFVANDGAEVGIGLFFLVTVAAAAVVEIRAVANVALVFIGPTHKAVIAVFWLHDGESYSADLESAMAFVVCRSW